MNATMQQTGRRCVFCGEPNRLTDRRWHPPVFARVDEVDYCATRCAHHTALFCARPLRPYGAGVYICRPRHLRRARKQRERHEAWETGVRKAYETGMLFMRSPLFVGVVDAYEVGPRLLLGCVQE